MEYMVQYRNWWDDRLGRPISDGPMPLGEGVSNGVCKGWVSLRKEAHCWLSTRRRVNSGARLKQRALSV